MQKLKPSDEINIRKMLSEWKFIKAKSFFGME